MLLPYVASSQAKVPAHLALVSFMSLTTFERFRGLLAEYLFVVPAGLPEMVEAIAVGDLLDQHLVRVAVM